MDEEKLIRWIYKNEERVAIDNDEYWGISSNKLVFAIGNGEFNKDTEKITKIITIFSDYVGNDYDSDLCDAMRDAVNILRRIQYAVA